MYESGNQSVFVMSSAMRIASSPEIMSEKLSSTKVQLIKSPQTQRWVREACEYPTTASKADWMPRDQNVFGCVGNGRWAVWETQTTGGGGPARTGEAWSSDAKGTHFKCVYPVLLTSYR